MGGAQRACCWAHLRTQVAPVVFATSPLWSNFCLQHTLLQIRERCWVILFAPCIKYSGKYMSMNEKYRLQICLNWVCRAKQQTKKRRCRNIQWRGQDDDTPNQTPIVLPCYALSWFLMLAQYAFPVSGWVHVLKILMIAIIIALACLSGWVSPIIVSGNQAIPIPAADEPEPDIRSHPLICICWFLYRTLKKLAGDTRHLNKCSATTSGNYSVIHWTEWVACRAAAFEEIFLGIFLHGLPIPNPSQFYTRWQL